MRLRRHPRMCVGAQFPAMARLSWQEQHYESHCFDQIAFTPSDQSLLFDKPDRTVVLWPFPSAAPAEPEAVWIEPSERQEGESSTSVGQLSFSPDGTLLAYSLNGILGIWAWPSGECLGKWKVPGRGPIFYQLGFSVSGRELIASYWSAPMGVHVYKVADFMNKK